MLPPYVADQFGRGAEGLATLASTMGCAALIGGLFFLDGKTTTIAFGRYIDQLEKRNGEWRIVTRRCTIEMSADTDGTWVYSKNVKGFLKALWSKDDPSYERPIVAKPQSDGVRW